MRRTITHRGIPSLCKEWGQTQCPITDKALVATAVFILAGVSQAQDVSIPPTMVGHSPETYQLGHSPLDEPAALAKTDRSAPSRYFIPIGSGGLNLNAGLKTEYVDNVFLTKDNRADDFILVPECDISTFFPVGQLNSIALDVGLAYYEYLKNTKLNTGVPLINPNTDLGFNLKSGDFTFKFTERFSYQENPVYETGSEFFNFHDTALFQRYFNRIGGLVTWDQHDLVMTAGYYHENLWSESSTYNYVDHSSELFSADAMLATSSRLKVGLEAAGSINNFDNTSSYDTWRARVGPALRINASEFIKIKLGAGYERIQYDSAAASTLGLTPDNTFYAYGDIEHEINHFFRHALTLSHDNQLGFNAANLEDTSLAYSLTWTPRKQLSISPLFSVNFFNESFGSKTANLFHERFTYYRVGLAAHYQLGQHWNAGAGWNYRLNDSEIVVNRYWQNQVSLEVVYQF